MTKTLEPFLAVLADRHGFLRRLKAERGRKVAGYFCDYVPEELLWAAGMDPVRITAGRGNVTAADQHLQSNVCSFARRCFDQILTGVYDYLDAGVVAHTCDVMTKMYDLWAYRCRDPEFLHYFWVPHNVFDKDAFAVMLGEVKRMKKCTEEFIGRSISDAELEEAITVYDRNRTLLRELYDLRRPDPPRLAGVEAFSAALTSMLVPKDVHNSWLEALLEERKNAPAPAAARQPRILIIASMLDDVSLIAAVENTGARVVNEEVCSSTRYFYDRVGATDGNPLAALTRRYQNKLPCPRSVGSLAPRRDHIFHLVKDFGVNGVIFYILRCCDAHLFQYPLLKEALESAGIPMLYLQGDQTVGVNEAVQNRIEAFTEMLKS